MKSFKNILLVIVLLGFVVNGCQKPERDNPWDELAELNPEEWAPKQLQVQSQDLLNNTLKWSFEDKNIQGFHIDRKVGEQAWQEEYLKLPKTARSWNDSLISPDTSVTYQYRVYAYAGNNESAQTATSFTPLFEAPSNLQIEQLNDISFQLSWLNNTLWPENPALPQGFKIDRKTDEQEWQLAIATLPHNISNWVDTNVLVNRAESTVQYRVYAFYGELKTTALQSVQATSLTPPSELTIAQNSLTSVTLSWQNNNQGAQGFILERSYDGQSWQQLQKNTLTSYTDEDFELNRLAFYRLAAYYDDYVSNYTSNSFDAQIPIIPAIDYSINGSTSVTLSWTYPETGFEGFLVERQLNEGDWLEMTTIEASDQPSYADESIDLMQNDYNYRISVKVGEKYSDYQNLSFALPQVSTTEAYSITDQTALSGGDITSTGSPQLTQKGICWSTNPNPGIADFITQEGNEPGVFTSQISGLSPLTSYYVRAYAINAIGIEYGLEKMFTTIIYPPTVTTSAITNITATSATSGGNVTEQGSTLVTQGGVCWNTSPNPTTADNFTNDGSGMGIFTSELNELEASTTYYLRAYAINTGGTSYGPELIFVTSSEDDVYNPATGKIWKDKNLGASRVAQSSADEQAYGDLYQWGRGSDGHEKRTSSTSSTLSSVDSPVHGRFILAPVSPYDWRSPQNGDLWQGISGTNNPCPEGYRLPTSAEWQAERASWSINNTAGAFASPLKLPAGGSRSYSDGTLYNIGLYGIYWSAESAGSQSSRLVFFSTDASVNSTNRANGFSVRCIKD